MTYHKPETVQSPKERWKFGKVLCSTGDAGWSVVEGIWDGKYAIGMRWNGSDWDKKKAGNPQSRGNPTFFIIPSEFYDVIKERAMELDKTIEMVNCVINRPDDFDEGAYRVSVTLQNAALDILKDTQVTFPLPNIKRWSLLPVDDDGAGHDFNAVIMDANGIMKRCGRVLGGKWMAYLYTNGIAVADNPIPLEEVRRMIVDAIMTAIRVHL